MLRCISCGAAHHSLEVVQRRQEVSGNPGRVFRRLDQQLLSNQDSTCAYYHLRSCTGPKFVVTLPAFSFCKSWVHLCVLIALMGARALSWSLVVYGGSGNGPLGESVDFFHRLLSTPFFSSDSNIALTQAEASQFQGAAK